MRDRTATTAPVVAIAGAVGLCCGLPVLLSLGVLGAAAGLSRQSWALIGLGLVLAVLGWVRLARHRRSTGRHCAPSAEHAPQDRVTDLSCDPSLKRDHR